LINLSSNGKKGHCFVWRFLIEDSVVLSVKISCFLKVTVGCDNPFKWAPDSKDINTGFVMVNVWNKKKGELFEVSGISEPINLYLTPHISSSSSTEELAEGNVSVPVAALRNNKMLEDCITVHKIPCKKGQTSYLKFKPLDDPFSKLQVS
jgi:hypothetical protein